MERDNELAFVDPSRRALVRKRMEVLERYVALAEPNWRDVAEAAAEIGVAPSTLYALARSWRTDRDPLTLQASGRWTKGTGPRVLGDEAFVASVLDRLGHAASVEQDVLHVERVAAETGTPVRSRSALRRLVRTLRPRPDAARPSDAAPIGEIAIDHAAIRIPVATRDGTTLPIATVILHSRSSSVLAVHLSLETPTAGSAAAAMLRWLQGDVPPTSSGSDATRVAAARIHTGSNDPAWGTLLAALSEQRISRVGKTDARIGTGFALAPAFGRELFGLPMHTRMTHRPAAGRRPPDAVRLHRAVSLGEAQVVVDGRMGASGNPPRLWMPDPPALVRRLKEIGSDPS